MDFIVVRLGKDSVSNIKKLNETSSVKFKPYTFKFTCKQVESSIKPNCYVFLYIGSDNNKGIPTDWKQGMRALGILKSIDGWENFQSTCVLTIEVFSVFSESLDQFNFLEKSPNLYKHFSKYPIVGVKSSRNNSVQKVNNDIRENSSALLTAISSLYSNFKDDLNLRAPNLLSLLDFIPESDLEVPSNSESKNLVSNKSDTRGENVIYYGAAGTGKSHKINERINLKNAFISVFHAETMNSDFVGSIKPDIYLDDSNKEHLTYKFIPGAFTKAIVESLNHSENHYWLVIEEINRAPAAAVFGEIFQLLDRRKDGRSKYEIDFPDLLCEKFINRELKTPIDRLFIPSNLSILASMNSSDQGVLPLDTAFKRRWSFEYIALNFESGCTQGDLHINLEDGVTGVISWADFASVINLTIGRKGIQEDRHLGPYFISEQEIGQLNILTGKLFMYLWDDVLRHGLRYEVFHKKITTYGQLIKGWEEGEQVFNSDFLIEVRPFIDTSSLLQNS
ncbi:AAA family ATPase [Colwellia sp. MB3u-4]|uniref:AAA family ATPase n=1 Tax=Colwellia sp. MB3u-4 TaxID=2759822 RepID=UPI0015F66E3F|nr:AAA family ATPase [Colwellia sp. MB3u-4]MBA6289483.1 AAA family ATPase [Colwellia sp. MB3u-4]